jgi:hypothetical protein
LTTDWLFGSKWKDGFSGNCVYQLQRFH